MKKIAIIVAVSALGLGGCAASQNYQLYAETQQAIAESNARAEMARVQALSEIAKNGDATSQVAAVITLNLGNSNNQQTQTSMRAPESTGDTLLKWTQVLLPNLTQVYGINKSTDLAVTQSNNSRDIALNNTDSMVDMGKLIADQEVPVVGTSEDRLIYPEPTITTGVDSEGNEVLLYPND